MARIFAFCAAIFVSAGAALAQAWQDNEFDARELTGTELRIVQAALTFSGDYLGLLDGQWGQRSQAALEAYVGRQARDPKPKYRHLIPLLAAFEAERREKGWITNRVGDTGLSFASPSGWAVFDAAESRGTTYLVHSSPGRDFLYLLDFSGFEVISRLHRELRHASDLREIPYTMDGRSRIVTSVVKRDGWRIYLRTDATPLGVVSIAIYADYLHRHRLALMAASIRQGWAPDLEVPRGGLLDRLDRLMTPTVPSVPRSAEAWSPVPAPAPAAVPDSKPDDPDGSGTGFYVAPDRLVTAAHVVEGCRRVALADGTTLSVIRTDSALDLALLGAPRRSPVWIVPDRDRPARLGEQVTALGYPYFGTLGQGLTVTAGNVSALQGIFGDSSRIMISAPVQPGNSGGPLLDKSGALVGVVLSRLNELKILEVTGSLPQNMNFALAAEDLVVFLDAAGVAVETLQRERHDMTDAVPDAVAASVVPVICRN